MELEKKSLANRKGFYFQWWSFLHIAKKLAQKKTASGSSEAHRSSSLREKKVPLREKIADALVASQEFYELWEIDKPKYEKFDNWWNDKSVLFEEKYQVRVLNHGEMPSDLNALVIEVPLRSSATKLNREVRALIMTAQNKQISKFKSRKNPSAGFALTLGAEPKYIALRDMMTVYRDVQLPNILQHDHIGQKATKKLKGFQLLHAINNHFENRRKPKKVPTTLQLRDGRQADNLNALRSLNRYLTKAERIILNVANGKFPGKY